MKRAEAKYNLFQVEKAKKEIENAYGHTFTKGEIEEILQQANTDTTRTGCFFICLIFTMIIDMFWVLIIFLLTLIIWYADEEVEMLHAMEDVDTKVFNLQLGDPVVLLQCIM